MVTKLSLALALILAAVPAAWAVKPTRAEIGQAHAWAVAHFGKGAKAPFSFSLDSRPVDLATWKLQTSKNGATTTDVYTDPAAGIAVTCRATEYRDYPTVEWTLTFKNTGRTDSPILSRIRPMDFDVQRPDQGEFVLHYNAGDSSVAESYQPFADSLEAGATRLFASAGGRPTNGGFPYWNVELPGGGGVIAVLSWGGQWAADISRDKGQLLMVRAGQELTHFTLHPGEEVTSPMGIVQVYGGDWIRGQNIWRSWMLRHNSPRIKGKLQAPLQYMCDNGYYPGLRSTLADEKMFIDRFVKEKIGMGYWDLDAGWYPCDQLNQWWEVGNWEPDTKRFPGGIRAMSDYLHLNGIKQILWFEPERVYSGTWLAKNHPEWIYGGDKGGLIKLGQPDCWKWIVNRIDSLITSEGVDVYRQDFNIDPLAYWRANDPEDRQGITEIRHVEGYYAFWDELRRRHPNLLIDTCASGGRRNNVETLRRSVPILRSDYSGEPIGSQGHTYGLSMWMPINGTGLLMNNAYTCRSCMAPIFGVSWDIRQPGCDWDLMRKMVAQWRQLSRCMLGDYYPLTPYSLAKDAWIAWQFDLPDSGEGMVQAFRRDDSKEESRMLKLGGLEPKARYRVTDLDTGVSETLTGAALATEGLKIAISIHPGSAMISYKRL